MVLEAVELGTTNPFQYFDEMVVLLFLLCFFPNQLLVRSGDDHVVLAASVFDAGSDEHVCDSYIYEGPSFVLLLGNDASAARNFYLEISQTLRRRQYLRTLLINYTGRKVRSLKGYRVLKRLGST